MNHNNFYRYPSEYVVNAPLIKRVGQAFYISGKLSYFILDNIHNLLLFNGHYNSQSFFNFNVYIVNRTQPDRLSVIYLEDRGKNSAFEPY
jgi:hypothetical protein